MIGLLLSLSPLFIALCGKSAPVKSRSREGSWTSLSSEKVSTPKVVSKSKSAEAQRTASKKNSDDLKKIEEEKVKVKIIAELEELAEWFKKHLPKCGFSFGKDNCECLDLRKKANAIVEKHCKELQEPPTAGGAWKEVEAKHTQLLEQVRVNAKLSKEREMRSEKTQVSQKSSRHNVSKEKAEEKSKETKSKDTKKRRKPRQKKSKQPDSGDKLSKMSMAAPADAVIGEYEALIDKEKEHVVTQETQDSDSV